MSAYVTTWTPELEAKLRELWGTRSTHRIGIMLGITKNAVIGKASRMGLERLKAQRPLDVEKAMQMYLTGANDVKVAMACDCDPATVWRWRARNGLRANLASTRKLYPARKILEPAQ